MQVHNELGLEWNKDGVNVLEHLIGSKEYVQHAEERPSATTGYRHAPCWHEQQASCIPPTVAKLHEEGTSSCEAGTLNRDRRLCRRVRRDGVWQSNGQAHLPIGPPAAPARLQGGRTCTASTTRRGAASPSGHMGESGVAVHGNDQGLRFEPNVSKWLEDGI